MLYSLVLADPTLWGRGDGAYQVDIIYKCPLRGTGEMSNTFFL